MKIAGSRRYDGYPTLYFAIMAPSQIGNGVNVLFGNIRIASRSRCTCWPFRRLHLGDPAVARNRPRQGLAVSTQPLAARKAAGSRISMIALITAVLSGARS